MEEAGAAGEGGRGVLGEMEAAAVGTEEAGAAEGGLRGAGGVGFAGGGGGFGGKGGSMGRRRGPAVDVDVAHVLPDLSQDLLLREVG